eukprot:CAMPEP_0185023448 /NCGR_PEP_ID=MMETSP1103-20130426/6123_1 /TAXON_ID=36769 /ORGANISM="Paraphysomonas bandaiensis, Strain Caron Lab Isolate" /LENGTH=275 /DNA_ID=CAMNT_0027556049 /DNA_START=504 /DNA_END=1331 /DNA_ORIENTATION=+
MIQELYGSDYKICEEARITQKEIEENRRRHIDYENFEKLAGAYPALLYPAFVYQHVLRSKVLGERFWKPLETVRAHLMPSKHIKYVPVRVLLMSRTDRQAIRRYVENREQISAMKIATLRSMNSMKLPRDRRGSQSDVESSTNAPSSPSTQSRRRHSNVGKHMDMHGTFLSSMYRDIKRSLSGAELNQPFNLQPSRFRFSGDKAISESRESNDNSSVDAKEPTSRRPDNYIWLSKVFTQLRYSLLSNTSVVGGSTSTTKVKKLKSVPVLVSPKEG